VIWSLKTEFTLPDYLPENLFQRGDCDHEIEAFFSSICSAGHAVQYDRKQPARESRGGGSGPQSSGAPKNGDVVDAEFRNIDDRKP